MVGASIMNTLSGELETSRVSPGGKLGVPAGVGPGTVVKSVLGGTAPALGGGTRVYRCLLSALYLCHVEHGSL